MSFLACVGPGFLSTSPLERSNDKQEQYANVDTDRFEDLNFDIHAIIDRRDVTSLRTF